MTLADLSKATLRTEELSLGDVEILSDTKGNWSMTDKIEVLSRVIEGVEVRDIKIAQLPAVMELIEKALEGAANPT